MTAKCDEVLAKARVGFSLLTAAGVLLAAVESVAAQGKPVPATADIRAKVDGKEKPAGAKENDKPAALSPPPLTLRGDNNGVWFAKYSPTGDRLATGGNSGTVTLWTKALSPAEHPFKSRAGVYWDADFAPDGKTFAVGGQDKLTIFDSLSGQIKLVIPFKQLVCTVAYSSDSKYLAAGTGSWQKPDEPAQGALFDVATGQELAKLPGHAMRMFRVRFSPDGKTLATSSRDKTIRLWEVPSGKLKGIINSGGAVKGLAFLPDGTLVSASYDGWIRLWNTDSAKEKKAWKANMVMASLDVSPDGTLLAVAESSAEGKGPAPLKIFDAASGKELLQLEGHAGRILGLAFTRDGRGLVTAGGALSAYGEINYFDLVTGKLRSTRKTPGQWMETAAVSADGKRVLSAAVNGMHMWNLDFTHPDKTWTAHTNLVSSGIFFDQGRFLATGSWDTTIKIWDVRKPGNPVATCEGHTVGGIRALAVLPDGKTLFSGGQDKTIKVWDAMTGVEKATLQGNTGVVYALAVSPDGKTLASGGGDHRTPNPGELILWDIESGKPRLTIPNVERCVFSLAYSPDGALLAGAIAARLVKIWDAKTGELRQTLAANQTRPLTFSPDGKFLIVAGGRGPAGQTPGAGQIRIWDTATWKEQATLDGHNEVIFDVHAAPDSGSIATAGGDGTTKLWSIPGVTGIRPPLPINFTLPTKTTDAVSVNRLVGTGDATGRVLADTEEAPGGVSGRVWLAMSLAIVLAVLSLLGLLRARRAVRSPAPVHAAMAAPKRRTAVAAASSAPSAPPRRRFAMPARSVLLIVLVGLGLGAGMIAFGITRYAGASAPEPQTVEEPSGLLRNLKGHTDPVHGLRFTPDGTKLVTSSGWPERYGKESDRSVRIWDVAEGKELKRIAAPGQSGWLEISADGKHAFVGTLGRSIYIDLATGEVIKSFKGHTTSVSGVCLAADGRHAFTASLDSTVRRWDLNEGKEIGRFKVNGKWARRVAELPGGGRIVTADNDGLLQIWDVEKGDELKRINGGPMWLGSMTLAPGGKEALVAGWDIAVWDLETGKKGRVFTGHGGEVTAISFSSDGRFMLTASHDGAVRLWDYASGEVLRTLNHSEKEYVFATTFSPDGKTVATAGGGYGKDGKYFPGDDHDIRLWNVAQAEVVAAAQTDAIWWIVAGALVAMLALVVGGIGVHFGRRAALPSARTRTLATVSATNGSPGSIGFACSRCGKHLKAKVEFSGRKIKCPQCGNAMPIPTRHAADLSK